MRRTPRSWIAVLLAVSTLMLVHACSEDVTAPDRNEAPDTEVWASAPRDLGAEFAIDFVFTGTDDREGLAFEWRVLEPSVTDPSWTRSEGADLTLSFPKDTSETGFENPGTHRTLEVRAVDASGVADPTPAVVSFTPLTVAPQVAFDPPLPNALTCLQAGRALTFRWEGTDLDAKSGTPAQVRYMLKQYGEPIEPCLTRTEYEAGTFPISTADPEWSSWVDYGSGLEDGPGVRLPVFPAGLVGSSFVFAVQVRDLHGATSRGFVWNQQIVHVRISDNRYPYLAIDEPTLGQDVVVGPNTIRSYEITPGQDLQFSWTADASEYFGEVEDFRYGWDVSDPDDPDDPGWAVDWGDWSEAPAQSFVTGFHNFVLQVRDRAGAITRVAYQLTVGEPTGVPELEFSVHVDVGPGGDPVWELRWIGGPGGPAPESPEQTANPFAGFARRFKVEWEATSPNGPIVGYRYRVKQGSAEFVPPAVGGEKQWDPEATSFVFGNEVAPESLGPECDTNAIGCDPALVRFPSGNYNLAVEALDAAQVESPPEDGLLDFSVNYPPETSLVLDATWPRYEVRDAVGTLLASGPVAEGDTIPAMSTVFFRSSGYDKFADELPPGVPADSLCCDTPLNYDPLLDPGDPGFVPLVEYQSRLVTVRREGDEPVGRTLSNTFSAPDLADTISFWAGPLDYTYHSRTVDEHRRADSSTETREFVAGFPPRIREDLLVPGGDIAGLPGDVADTLLISPLLDFPDNEIPYVKIPGVTKYWLPDPTADCEGVLLDDEPIGGVQQFGVEYLILMKFVGEQDPRDPLSPVRAWSFAIFSDKDPDNLVEDGLESRDLSFFNDSPQPNEWEFAPEEAIRIWVPFPLATNPDSYSPTSTDPVLRSVGCLVAKRLGNMTLRLRGRTTGNADEYAFYAGTRKSAEGAVTPVSIGEFGRQSAETTVELKFLVGTGTDHLAPESYWPDF